MTPAPWAPTGCATCDRSLLRSDWFDEQGMQGIGADVRAAVADRITAGHVDCPPIDQATPDRAAASITCPRCGRTSWNPNDVREGYCGACHDWTRLQPPDQQPGPARGDDRPPIG